MEKLGLNKLRTMFQDFYENKGHYKRKSFSLVPKGDKSLLIINSGMAPLKPYFAGLEKPPANRMTTCQKCIRTADIENVGITSRHGTFFEMLGSFSFGDYFKRESIFWGFEFINDVLHLPIEKVWVSVYEEDEEAYNIWKDELNFPTERIVKLGKEDNFWEIGAGPCGPCSEMYFDRGEEFGCENKDCKPGCDCDRFVEFWNHVFTQFNNDGFGNYTELKQKNIDTGMGLERLACIMQGVDSIFDVDTIATVVNAVEKATKTEYMKGKKETDVSIRIITDHIRSATFMIGDKIMPSNEGRGYILRRLIRRAARHGRKLGLREAFLKDIVNVVIDTCGEAYKELEEQRVFICKIVDMEEDKFMSTLEQGMDIISEYVSEMKKVGEKTLSGEKAFKLHDTYGFPIDITEEILADEGYEIDREGFEKAMDIQKKAGKEDAKEKDFAWEGNAINSLFEGKTQFTGYEKTVDEGYIKGLFLENEPLTSIKEGEVGQIILEKTPFYPKGGGQSFDFGIIYNDDFKGKILQVEKHQNVIVHKVKIEKGICMSNSKVTCMVAEAERNNSARNHTATHLLHKALKEVLGSHIQQAGSAVDFETLRFDFNHYEAMSEKQIVEVEKIVNDKIEKFIPVYTKEMSLKEATLEGAIGLFEEKYQEDVRVVSIGEYSKELCGGIHVSNSGQIGGFKIISESSVASGVRRIEAITGKALLNYLNKYENIINTLSETLKTTPNSCVEKLNSLILENKENKRELDNIKKKSLGDASEKLFESGKDINGITLITKEFKELSVDDLRKISDDIKAIHKNTAIVLATTSVDKVTFLVSLTDDVVSKGYHAGKMIKEIAAAAGGGGGGKAHMAQAGGKNPEKVNDAFKVAEKLLS